MFITIILCVHLQNRIENSMRPRRHSYNVYNNIIYNKYNPPTVKPARFRIIFVPLVPLNKYLLSMCQKLKCRGFFFQFFFFLFILSSIQFHRATPRWFGCSNFFSHTYTVIQMSSFLMVSFTISGGKRIPLGSGRGLTLWKKNTHIHIYICSRVCIYIQCSRANLSSKGLLVKPILFPPRTYTVYSYIYINHISRYIIYAGYVLFRIRAYNCCIRFQLYVLRGTIRTSASGGVFESQGRLLYISRVQTCALYA